MILYDGMALEVIMEAVAQLNALADEVIRDGLGSCFKVVVEPREFEDEDTYCAISLGSLVLWDVNDESCDCRGEPTKDDLLVHLMQRIEVHARSCSRLSYECSLVLNKNREGRVGA